MPDEIRTKFLAFTAFSRGEKKEIKKGFRRPMKFVLAGRDLLNLYQARLIWFTAWSYRSVVSEGEFEILINCVYLWCHKNHGNWVHPFFFLGHSKHILQSCIAIFAEVIIFSSNTIKVDKMNFLFLSDFLACGAELEKKRNIVTQFDEIINTLYDKFVNRLLSYAIFLLPRI